jgi:hypothetical protein
MAVEQGSQTHGPHVARLMRLFGPRHHKNYNHVAEITALVAVKTHPLLRPAETDFCLNVACELIFFVKMWPSNEFELETPAVGLKRPGVKSF